jgi:Pyruvate/2-oxoacid:ferredoxin oxidoreductase delta subunit
MGIIEINKLPDFIAALQKEYTVYAPVNDADGEITLAEVNTDVDIPLDFVNFTLSPKELFFPQCEVLYTLDRRGVKDMPQPEGKFVAFAVKPCDADALKSIDKVFVDETTGYLDPYFAARRQNGVLIALACNDPCTTCFCTSVGSGPSSEKGADILMTRLDDTLLFKACTDKGRVMLEANAESFREATDEEQKARDDRAAAAVEKIQKVDTEGVSEKLAKEGFDFTVWNDMFSRCLGCGVCTYVCPTCHCFDIVDEIEGTEQGESIRAWDSCQFSLFTLHTSGHNPRPSKKERMRQRIMHKFSYTVENFDEIFCVGCGRCVRHCPVNLDIREMIDTLRTWDEPMD